MTGRVGGDGELRLFPADRAGIAQSVAHVSGSGMLDPRLESHQCLYVCKYVDQIWLGYLSGHHKVSRCHTRGESEESIPCR